MNRPPIQLGVLLVALGLLVGGSVVWLLQAGEGSGGGLPRIRFGRAATTAPAPQSDGVVFSGTNQRSASTPDLIPTAIPFVYAFYYLAELGTSALGGAAWTRDGKALPAIAAGDIVSDQRRPGSGWIALRAPNGRLTAGVYELELHTERRRYRASFVAADQAEAIMSQPAPPTAGLTVLKHMMASGVKASGEPERVGSSFRPEDRIFFAMQYKDGDAGMAITVKWWGGDVEIKTARQEIQLPAESGWAQSWIQAPAGLPQGTYYVTVTTTGGAQELARDQFIVR